MEGVVLVGLAVPGVGDAGLFPGAVPGEVVPGLPCGFGLLISGAGIVGALSGVGVVGTVSGVGAGDVLGVADGAAVPGVGAAVPGVGVAVPTLRAVMWKVVSTSVSWVSPRGDSST